MPKQPHVSIRINCPLGLYEKISEYRHLARHETRAQAMVTLLAAGLAALAKPASVPPPVKSGLVPFAGSEGPGDRRKARMINGELQP